MRRLWPEVLACLCFVLSPILFAWLAMCLAEIARGTY
jgi:hypothetical protein